MPDVGRFGAGFREKEGSDYLASIRPQPRRPILAENRHMGAEPGGMMAPAGEAPGPGQPIAVRDRAGLRRARRTPGDDASPTPEDLPRHLRVEQGRRHRATVSLAEAPCGAGVVLRHLLHDLHI